MESGNCWFDEVDVSREVWMGSGDIGRISAGRTCTGVDTSVKYHLIQLGFIPNRI
jgi:hypothetical protein